MTSEDSDIRTEPPADAAPQPSPPTDAPQDPQRIIDELRRQCADLEDRLRRAQAECANIPKRLEQQHAQALKLAVMDFARALLGVRDSFDLTLASLADRAEDDPVAAGVRLIVGQLDKLLGDYGIEPIEAVGKPFDPALHEALLHDHDSDRAAGTVTRELQRGYTMHRRVLRPARVAVAGPPVDEAAAPADECAGAT